MHGRLKDIIFLKINISPTIYPWEKNIDLFK